MVCTAHELCVLWQHADCVCSGRERERQRQRKMSCKQCKSFASISSVLSRHVLSHQDLIKFHARNTSTETDWKQQSMQCSSFVLKATNRLETIITKQTWRKHCFTLGRGQNCWNTKVRISLQWHFLPCQQQSYLFPTSSYCLAQPKKKKKGANSCAWHCMS